MNRRNFLRGIFASAALACCPILRRRVQRTNKPINAGHINTVTRFKRPSQVYFTYQREAEFVTDFKGDGLHPDYLDAYRNAIVQFRKFKDTKGQPLVWTSS